MAGFHYQPDYNEIYDFNRQQTMGNEQLPHQQISVNIKLSNLTKLQSVQVGLKKNWLDCEIFDEPNNYVITVSGYPPRVGFGEKEVLNIVKKYDKMAVIC